MPLIKKIFDYKTEFVNRRGNFSWNVKGFEKELVHEHTIKQAWDIVRIAFNHNEYVDVHCGVFTELSFIELLKTLVILDLLDFRIVQFFKRTGHEFFVSLEAIDLSLSYIERKRIILNSINVTQKKIDDYFLQSIFDYRSWKIVYILRLIQKKFFH